MMRERKDKLLLMLAIAISVIFLQTGAQAYTFGVCDPADSEAKKCFTSNPSGYVFRIVEQGESCGSGADFVQSVTSFPYEYPDGKRKLWCYQVEIPATAKSAKPQILIQIPLSFYYKSGTTYFSYVADMNGSSSPKPIAFNYNDSIGCLGDTTGFEKGDREECGMQWSYATTVAGGSTQRFYHITDSSKVGYPGVAPQILAAKISSSFETGMILGADSSASPFTPQASYMCQQVLEKSLRLLKDGDGCVSAVEDCGSAATNPNCEGICTPVTPQQLKLEIKKANCDPLAENCVVAPKATLRQIGILGTNNFCKEGQMTLHRNPSGTLVCRSSGCFIIY